jgi:hypothetical protein
LILRSGVREQNNDIYNEEARNAIIDESNASYNPFLQNNDLVRGPDDVTFLIHRGDKISEHNQQHGISKQFYAQEECIVYASKYNISDNNITHSLSYFLKKLSITLKMLIYLKTKSGWTFRNSIRSINLKFTSSTITTTQ